MEKFEHNIDVKKVKEEVIETGRKLTEEETLTLLGKLEAKENRLMAIENVLKNISAEYCTPKVKADIQLALRIIKG